MANVLTSWSPDKKYSDRERWVCIYPAYINSKKTLAEGRRMAKDQCVENPTPQEIRDVLAASGFNIGVENKLYPREKSKEIFQRGRIRVQLKNDDGTPLNPKYPTRDSILLHLGDTIPKLKTRQNRNTEQPFTHQQTSGPQVAQKSKGKKGRR